MTTNDTRAQREEISRRYREDPEFREEIREGLRAKKERQRLRARERTAAKRGKSIDGEVAA